MRFGDFTSRGPAAEPSVDFDATPEALLRASGNHRPTPSAGAIAVVVLIWTALVAASLLAELFGGVSRHVAAASGILDGDPPRLATRDLALPLTWSHTSMWLIGLLGIAVATRMIRTRFQERLNVAQRKQDVDEIRRLNDSLERRVRERTAQWEAANRELEAFSFSVSHDLRAPLRAILGFSNMLSEQSGEDLDERGRHCVEVIRSESERMGRLIESLLRFSRAGKTELQPLTIDMTELVREVYQRLVEPLADRSVDFHLQPLPPATADPTLMRQVWTNLLDNALKYSRTRDTIRIEIGAEHRDGETVCFIRDNGVGFDPKYAGKLYQVFQRLHLPEEFEGDGIGLAIIQRIVHRHNGRTWAESTPGQGAAFFFTLKAVGSNADA